MVSWSRLARRSVAGGLAGVGMMLAGTASASSQIEAPFAKGQLAAVTAAPETLYPEGLHFDVVRDGSVVGRHRTTFRREGDALVVDSRMALDIGFLGITLYAFDYQSAGTWRDGVPVALEARTDDNGDIRHVRARWDGTIFSVDGAGPGWTSERPVWPTNHWNAAVLTEGAVLNTLTGRRNDVTIVPGPIERVETGTGPRVARRFDYQGGLQARVWYDARGRWVGLSFAGRDGVPITYVCRECGGEPNG